MQSAGNDFVVLDALQQPELLRLTSVDFYASLADRHFGIGADQILLLAAPPSETEPIIYRIFNADGHEVGQCGNGARCVARYLHDYYPQYWQGDTLQLQTQTKLLTIRFQCNDNIAVNMGTAVFTPEAIPFIATGLPQKTIHQDTVYALPLGDYQAWFSVLALGNPHAVHIVSDLKSHCLHDEAKLALQENIFPQQVNISAMEIISRNSIAIRVFERGAGETLACGSGACAAVIAGHRRGLLADKVTVFMSKGSVAVEITAYNELILSGDAQYVFTGESDSFGPAL